MGLENEGSRGGNTFFWRHRRDPATGTARNCGQGQGQGGQPGTGQGQGQGPGTGAGQGGGQGQGQRPNAGQRLGPHVDFAFLDADADGLIARAEFVDGLTLWYGALHAFRAADTDGDRKLDSVEYASTSFTTPFADLDADGNGKIDGQEIAAFLRANRSQP